MYNTSQKWKNNIYTNVQCAMNIYVDEVLVNPDYIFDFKKGGNIFDEELVLGSTPAQYIEMQVYKDMIPSSPKVVRVEYGILIDSGLSVAEMHNMLVGTLNGIQIQSIASSSKSFEMIPIGTYNVDDFTDNDDGTITIKAIDNMIKFEFNYDGSELINAKGGSAKLSEVAQDICNKAGVRLGSSTFLNSNKVIAVYDNTVSAREYIGYIAESAGCFAFIGRDGKLYFREIYQDTAEVSINLFADFKWSEEYKISKVSYEDGIRSFKFGNDERNTLWINQENMFIVDEEQVENIYNSVKNMTINSFEGRTIIDPAIDIGDKLIIDGKSVVYQGEMTLEGRFIADIKSKIQIKQKEDTTTRRESQKVINRRVQSNIDQINGTITLLAEETTENTHNIAQLEITAQGIASDVSSLETSLENNYYTKQQTNSQISQKADEITSSVSSQISTAKSEAINSANTSTDNKLRNYSTTTQMNSAITQKANEISSVVSTKVGKSEIISSINQTSESVKINASKISLSGLELNFTTNSMTLTSNYLNIDQYGRITSNNSTWGVLFRNTFLTVAKTGYYTLIYPDKIETANIEADYIYASKNMYVNNKAVIVNNQQVTGFAFYISTPYLEVNTSSYGAYGINVWGSDRRLKENIKDTEENALDIISKIQHRQFDWKETKVHENIGYIAQELEEVNEKFVLKIPQRDEEGEIIDERYQINETKIIPYLSKAIQELNAKVDFLMERSV